ncbi:MAG: DUF4422 domain-containing protein [Lachnospiraceae bacterium]|nr:DUF4422 domain-containing protein [Lachnospiraceae bacterium]
MKSNNALGNDNPFTKSDYFESLKGFKELLIFGCYEKEYSIACYYGFCVKAFLVSGQIPYPKTFCGLNVFALDEYLGDRESVAVIIGRAWDKTAETEEMLQRHGFRNFFPGVCQILTIIEKERLNEALDLYGCSVLWDNIQGKNEPDDSYEYKIRILACTSQSDYHKAISRHENKYVEYVQGGAAIADKRICETGDDTGDNISSQNNRYCELTVGYWGAKNINSDYIGLYHYGRGFEVEDSDLEQIYRQGIDVVLPIPVYWRWNIASYNNGIVNLLMDGIRGVSPEFLEAADSYLCDRFFLIGNLLVGKKEIYKAFYDWMFSVLRYTDDKLGGVWWTQRGPAYFGEHLYNIYFRKMAKELNSIMAPIKYLL